MSETLETVSQAFTAWRGSRRGGGRYPQALRERALGLLGKHGRRQVATALGISDPRVLDGWMRGSNGVAVRPQAVIAKRDAFSPFVEIAGVGGCDIELHGPDGSKLCVRGGADLQLVSVLAHAVLKQQPR